MKTAGLGRIDDIPRVLLSHTPTPLEEMPNLSAALAGPRLLVKRDDCTGLAMGGNKARQLEFYVGEAISQKADTILITGALQSNFVRSAAAAARKVGMECHIQLEERVANVSTLYRHSGNILLDRMFGATLHSYSEGEDEEGADQQLETIAAQLREQGKKPYVIHLSAGHPPLGALGYVVAAVEIIDQIKQDGLSIDEIVVASGSGATHSGLLFGLRAMANSIPVKGICVRREKELQRPRIVSRCQEIADLLGIDNPVRVSDIELDDDVLAPGYGKINAAVLEAIQLAAHNEGLILDPVYTGKAMAGFLERARQSTNQHNLLFIHTGGQPAVFSYEAELAPVLSENI
jgi:D-cysteine desulfhydrase/L-cysteate sulfo-lyase